MKHYKKIDPIDVHLANDGVVQAIGIGDIVKLYEDSKRHDERCAHERVAHPEAQPQLVLSWTLYQGCHACHL